MSIRWWRCWSWFVAGILLFSKIENAPLRQESHTGKMPLIAFPTSGCCRSA